MVSKDIRKAFQATKIANSMMIDESLPVIIRVAKGNNEAIVTARMVREGDHLYAVPTMKQGADVGAVQKILLEEGRLELHPNAARGRPSYRYQGLVRLDP
jgi:hypothetical protein